MNRRLLFLPTAALSAAVLFAACGGSAATQAPTSAASTPATGTPPAPRGTPAATLPDGSFALPSFSFAPDTGLAAKFPTTIDGQPVTNVQTAVFADVMKQFGTTDAQLQTMSQALNAVGIDFSRLSFGSATATVDGESVQLQALRTPDSDANKILQNYAVVAAAFGNAPGSVPTMTQTTIGGKNVTVAVDSSEKTSVLYVTGDTIFFLESTTDSQNTKILQALP